MGGAIDPLTRILTGDLLGIFIGAAVLTWPTCWVLLALYRRAVRRSMARTSGSAASRAAAPVSAAPPSSAIVAPVDVSTAASDTEDSGTLLRDLLTRPWRAARVYALAAIAYAVVLTVVTAWFAEPGAPFRPIRFLLLTTMFVWPVVPTLAIVAGSVRQRKLAIGCVYAIAYATLMIIGTLASSEFSLWQGVQLWALYNVPGTAVFALCVSRRIRAVGPLVMLFLFVGLLGADALIRIAGSNDRWLRRAVTIGGWMGLGGSGTFFATILAGFAAFAVVGAALLVWIRRRYEAKQLSDESLTIDTLWWLYAFGHAIGLAFEHPLAPLSGVAAMVAFKVVTRLGLPYASPAAGIDRKLLLLRSFSIGPRAERLFDALEKHWRRVGSIQMIAGDDLATRTVEPHEFLDFLTGKLARRFVVGAAALERRLKEMDVRPDRDGRFRVNDFFCYEDTWRAALSALVHESDAVLMDLRGFSRRNAGCVFEIGELFRLVPIDRVLFVVDRETDAAFLEETFGRAAALAAAAGGRSLAGPLQPRLLSCVSLDARTLQGLLRALAASARPPTLAGAR